MKTIVSFLISAAILLGNTVSAETNAGKCSPENTEKFLVLVQDLLEASVKHDGYLMKSISKTLKSNKVAELRKHIQSEEFKAIKESTGKVVQKLSDFATAHPECDSRNYREPLVL